MDGGSEADDNLQLLCRPCHAAKTSAEGVEQRRRRSPRRTPKKHPGIVG
jgi:5-methylcytosine-specific restriction endonuclease McrA